MEEYKKGDIAVCQQNVTDHWKEGKMFQIVKVEESCLHGIGESIYKNVCRKATLVEIQAYNKGIRNIKDISIEYNSLQMVEIW